MVKVSKIYIDCECPCECMYENITLQGDCKTHIHIYTMTLVVMTVTLASLKIEVSSKLMLKYTEKYNTIDTANDLCVCCCVKVNKLIASTYTANGAVCIFNYRARAPHLHEMYGAAVFMWRLLVTLCRSANFLCTPIIVRRECESNSFILVTRWVIR